MVDSNILGEGRSDVDDGADDRRDGVRILELERASVFTGSEAAATATRLSRDFIVILM